MSDSALINYVRISPNKTKGRTHGIDTITIHCMAGDLTVERCGELFANPARNASSNYGIGSDGRIALYVNECDRSWCSSNPANDARAITIEVANNGGADTGWRVSEKAMESLILLLADICKRNGIPKLIWSTNKNDRINHNNGCNMTVHRDYAAKACPGEYLYSKHSYIADSVNALLTKKKGDFVGMNEAEKRFFVEVFLYIGLLDREGDPAGIEHWVSLINDDTKVIDLLNRVTKSSEYQTRTITVAYQRLLGRDPDKAGLDHWKSEMAKGKTAVDIYAAIKGSEEYKKKHPTIVDKNNHLGDITK